MSLTEHTLGVIPARGASTRFPKKILAPLLGKPLIQHVWEQARKARALKKLVIATDDTEIASVAQGFGAEVVLTGECACGSERVALVLKENPWAECVVNIQGDEPLLQGKSIDGLVEALSANPHADIATLVVRKTDPEDFTNQNVVKVVFLESGRALYFSRSPLKSRSDGTYFKHIGIYAYRRGALEKFSSLPPSSLEKAESLEQLRALENQMHIQIVEVEKDTVAVDTPEDLFHAELALRMSQRE